MARLLLTEPSERLAPVVERQLGRQDRPELAVVGPGHSDGPGDSVEHREQEGDHLRGNGRLYPWMTLRKSAATPS